MTKYKVLGWRDAIGTIEILRETEKCYWTKSSWQKDGNRHLKEANPIYDTFEDAKRALVGKLRANILRQNVQIRHMTERLPALEDELHRAEAMTIADVKTSD